MATQTQTTPGRAASTSQTISSGPLSFRQFETGDELGRKTTRAMGATSVAGSPGSTGTGPAEVRFEPLPRRPRPSKMIDPALIARAQELLEDVERLDAGSMALATESLRCVFCEMWNSAAATTVFHHSILAIAESLVNSAESINPAQAAALRGAVTDLSGVNLTERHVEVARSRFIEEGYNPLAILSGMEHETDGGQELERSGGAG